MNRLRRSPAGFMRSLQMSSATVFVFVEGRDADPYVYGKICDTELSSRREYRVIMSEELPGPGAGKKKLLSWFERLRGGRNLSRTWKGHRYTTMFFLDKDLDDLRHTKKRSPHVVYTRYYDIENHIVLATDLVEAVAVAFSLSPGHAAQIIQDASNWPAKAAERWKEWIILCLLTQKLRVHSACNYSVTSRVNRAPHQSTDPGALAAYRSRLRRESGLSEDDFTAAYTRVERKVCALYRSGDQDCVFKGKWYLVILQSEVRAQLGKRPFNEKALGIRLLSAVAQSCDYTAPWSEHFRKALRELYAAI
jgi:hypothetical protein